MAGSAAARLPQVLTVGQDVSHSLLMESSIMQRPASGPESEPNYYHRGQYNILCAGQQEHEEKNKLIG